MPIYEFECTVCKIRVEVDRSIHEERDAQCCGQAMNRIYSAPGISFKGNGLGWTMTIYKWQCACKIWIETETEKQMDKAKSRHYKWHVKRGDVNE
jgi:putative FmdB family regulatory protein